VKDFTKLAEIVELDSDMMHAVMMTSTPPQHYWRPATLAVMAQVRSLRGQGLAACYTLDAGPNVHCLCPESSEADLREGLADLGLDYQILRGTPGGGARLVARS
jgi:diphosphomevalonate decarboxylase